MIPSPPQIEILKINSSDILFDLKADRNVTITHFNIEYRESSSMEWSDKNETKCNYRHRTYWCARFARTYQHCRVILHLYFLFTDLHSGTKYKLDDLKTNTDYILRARSINAIGYSEFSPEMKFRTAAYKSSAVKLTTPHLVLISVIILLNTYRWNLWKMVWSQAIANIEEGFEYGDSSRKEIRKNPDCS